MDKEKKQLLTKLGESVNSHESRIDFVDFVVENYNDFDSSDWVTFQDFINEIAEKIKANKSKFVDPKGNTRRIYKVNGINKEKGKLKKGFRYIKGGGIVEVAKKDEPIKEVKPMKWKGQRKSKNVEDRRSTKPGRKIVTLNSLASDSEKKRAAAKKKKSTGLNGPASTTKTVRVSKAAGTRADGTLKKGHRYVKGGGIVKVTKK